MPGWFIHNGKFHLDNDLVMSPNNRSFRYGDGLFETLRLHNNTIPLWDLHKQRLFSGLLTLGFQIPKLFTPDHLLQQVLALVNKNDLSYARIRITLYRGNGGLTDETDQSPGYTIQTWPVQPEPVALNINGLQIGVYHDARKSADKFSAVKSNSFLPYIQAANYARDQKWNDALILNNAGRIADSSIANVFWVKDSRVFTPPLSEGPIDGVMRRFLLENSLIHEKPLAKEDLMAADEVFLTNAFRGIQWVSFISERQLPSNLTASQLYFQYIAPLFS
jgi:branched-chain amino acid aminotransferase